MGRSLGRLAAARVLGGAGVVVGVVALTWLTLWVLRPNVISDGTPVLRQLTGYLGRVLPVETTTLSTGAEWLLTLLAVLVGVLGLYFAYARYRRGVLVNGPLRNASLRALYLDNLYDGAIGAPSKALARALNAMDQGVDGGVSGSAEVIAEPAGRVFSGWQSGFVRTYAVSMVLGTAAVMLYWAFSALGGTK